MISNGSVGKGTIQPDFLSSVHRTHIMGEENQLLQVV